MLDRLIKWLFICSVTTACLVAVFVFGLLVGHYKIWPNAEIRALQNNLVSLIRFQSLIPDGRRMNAPDGASDARHVVSDRGSAQPDGVFAAMGWDDTRSTYAAWLYDAQGVELHRWQIDDLTLSDKAQSRSNAPHALHLLPDGSIMMNFDRLGEVYRLDACSNVVWDADRHYHHSFSPSADGSIWTWAGRNDVGDDYQYLVRLDVENGMELERIGLIEDIFLRTEEQAVALSLGRDHQFPTSSDQAIDRFHPNDIEELPDDMAEAFPAFAAGDLLISVRNINLVAVVGRDGQMKWARYGPWFQQHDPDFNRDGTISVFDNNRGRGPSRIVSIDPNSAHELAVAWPVPLFTSAFRGKHQMLPVGTMLVTIPEEGRALEITRDGRVVREINNLSGRAGHHEDLANVKWYPPGYLSQMPDCQN